MRPTRTTALIFAAVTLAATAASPSPAAAFFFPIGLFLGPPRAMTFHRGPTESMGRGYTVKPGKAWTGTRSRDEDSEPSKSSTRTRSRDEDSKPSKASTRTSSKDDDSKPSKASTRTSSKDDDGKGSSKSGKGAKSATKEANAKQRRSVDHEAAASKGSGTSVQRASDTEGASLTATKSNTGDFDENLGEARIDDLVEQPPK